MGCLPNTLEFPRIVFVERWRVRLAPVEPNSDLAYFLGFALGDGSFAHRSISIHQSVSETKFVSYLKSLTLKLGEKYGGSVHERVEENRLVDITWSNSRISRMLRFLGKKRYDQIEGWMRGRCGAEFIGGLWDADGDVDVNHPRLHNTDLRVLRTTQTSMENLYGVKSTIRMNVPSGRKLRIRGKDYVSKRAVYSLQISRGSRQRWASVFGSRLMNPRKREAASSILGLKDRALSQISP